MADKSFIFEEIGGSSGNTGGSTVEITTDLTQEGKAADAAEVGRRFITAAGERAALGFRISALEQGGGTGGDTGGSSGNALDTEFYVVMKVEGNNPLVMTALEFIESQLGITCKVIKHYVSTAPTDIATPTVDDEGDYVFDIYIVESTGVVYVSGALAGINVLTLGSLCFQDPSADKGWSDYVGDENGVYTVRSVGTYDGAFETIHLFVQNSSNEISAMTKHQWEKIQKRFHRTILDIRLLYGQKIRLYPTFLGQNATTNTPDYCYSALVWGNDQTARAWQAWANDGNIVLNNRVID